MMNGELKTHSYLTTGHPCGETLDVQIYDQILEDRLYLRQLRIPEFSDTQSGVFVHVSVGSKAA
jgi:hypothetical protein